MDGKACACRAGWDFGLLFLGAFSLPGHDHCVGAGTFDFGVVLTPQGRVKIELAWLIATDARYDHLINRTRKNLAAVFYAVGLILNAGDRLRQIQFAAIVTRLFDLGKS